MKRLLVLCLLSAASLTASANQVAVFFTDKPRINPDVYNFVNTGNNVFFTVSGNTQGTVDTPVSLTYDFLNPMRIVEFGFRLTGAPVIAARATASYSESIDTIIADDDVHYFSANAEDSDLRQFTFSIPNYQNLNTADDVLSIVSIRGYARDSAYVPEPGTLGLFAIALVGMCGFKRRQRTW